MSFRSRLPVIIALFVLVACAGSTTATTPPPVTDLGPTAAVPETPASNVPAVYLLDAEGTPATGVLGSHCWDGMCEAYEVPPTPTTTIDLAPGLPIELVLSEPLPETVILSLRPADGGDIVSSVDMAPGGTHISWQPEVLPGEYILQAFSIWGENQDASHYFGLSITDTGAPVDDLSEPPALYLQAGDGTLVEGLLGTYCWTPPDAGGDVPGLCLDALWPPQPDTFTPVMSGEALAFFFEIFPPQGMSLSVFDAASMNMADPAMPDEALQQDQIALSGLSATWTPALDPGDYVLVIQVFWQDARNDAQYAFGISVDTGGASTPPAIRVAAADGAFLDGVPLSYCWGGLCADMPTQVNEAEMVGGFTPVAEGPFIDLALDFPLPTILQITLYAEDSAVGDTPIAETEITSPNATSRWQPDVAPGSYLLAISASWNEPQGDALYIYGITLP